MSVLMCSMWRNDSTRNLFVRAMHLTEKKKHYDDLKLLWVVGDSDDETFQMLSSFVVSRNYQSWIRVIEKDTDILSDEPADRLRRLSRTANVWIDNIENEEYFMIHESDLITPANIVAQFVSHAQNGVCPIAGWPVLKLGERTLFYDVWAYRINGEKFTNNPPYHTSLNGDDVFQVDSFGSCMLTRAEDVKGCRMTDRAILDLCEHLRNRDLALWVDRRIVIEQPKELWSVAKAVS